ncbi:hypothetical protein EUBIFOR_01474 [Holdemanella biformis DSM 3989]|uniref:Uncharacterized protein n=1 Tax=Holdemanella biformis DSM 3989 TaxID=518637 RepID=B7CB99_9FIRM|nr:hypothetical protein EUBIFOR_01474 [Holdemanella biformis DSM 3989]
MANKKHFLHSQKPHFYIIYHIQKKIISHEAKQHFKVHVSNRIM